MNVGIIGGGIAGLATAITLKQLNKNINVDVYEKNHVIGFNHDCRCCGEALILRRDSKWMPKKDHIFHHIYRVDIIIGKKTYTETFPSPISYTTVLNKPAFVNSLAQNAKELEVNLLTNKKISNPTQIPADIIVDASGCPSIIKKRLHLDSGFKGLTYQETLSDCNQYSDHQLKIYYFGKGGYYWIFPRNPTKKEVNVGVGLLQTKKVSLPKLLNQFKKKMNITGTPVYYAGGVIPLGLQKPFQKDNIIFVGDTAVGTFPYLGEGNRRSLINGEIAAYCIANNCVNQYSTKLLKQFYLWDILGKFGLKASRLASHISEDAMFFLLHRYFKFTSS